MTMVAVPAALAAETLLRWLLFPPELEALRAELRDVLTWVGWALVGVTAVTSWLAPRIQRRLTKRALRRIPEGMRTRERVELSRTGAFLLSSTLPQVPAISATLATMLGASYGPAITAAVIVTVAIGILAAVDGGAT
jgi:hypothetical protein